MRCVGCQSSADLETPVYNDQLLHSRLMCDAPALARHAVPVAMGLAC